MPTFIKQTAVEQQFMLIPRLIENALKRAVKSNGGGDDHDARTRVMSRSRHAPASAAGTVSPKEPAIGRRPSVEACVHGGLLSKRVDSSGLHSLLRAVSASGLSAVAADVVVISINFSNSQHEHQHHDNASHPLLSIISSATLNHIDTRVTTANRRKQFLFAHIKHSES